VATRNPAFCVESERNSAGTARPAAYPPQKHVGSGLGLPGMVLTLPERLDSVTTSWTKIAIRTRREHAGMKCRICESNCRHFARATVLGKYDVAYFRCTGCGYVQTEEPYWLDEAYSDAIIASDIGLVGRNLQFSTLTSRLIKLCFDGDSQFVDYGGGYGLFVRLMRDQGFDFYRCEPRCENLFARGLDVSLDGGRQFELLTAFEVLEHLDRPIEEIEGIRRLSSNLFFSTTLLPEPTPKPDDWWYYALDGGQHIGLFTRRSLQVVADRFHLRVISVGDLHLFTEARVSKRLVDFSLRSRFAGLLDRFQRRSSLLAVDYQRITGRKIA